MSPTIDATTKHRVKDAFVANAQARLESLLASAAAESEAADLDQDSAYSIDDIAQSDSAGDLTGLLERSAAAQRASIDNLRALDVSPTDRVGPGAIVEVDGQRYLVGVSSAAVDVEGASYDGLSLDAPLYAAIAGRRAGDAVDFRGRHISIDQLG